MAVHCELLLGSNNLSFRGGFFGFCNVVQVAVGVSRAALELLVR
ncbi:MAG: hypothetical protein ACKVOO_00190 [Burkholderiaceae bacterium]